MRATQLRRCRAPAKHDIHKDMHIIARCVYCHTLTHLRARVGKLVAAALGAVVGAVEERQEHPRLWDVCAVVAVGVRGVDLE